MPLSTDTSGAAGIAGDVPRTIWIDGALRPWAEATVHVLSHSLQRGSLVFDYMSVHDLAEGNAAGLPAGAAVFRLREHIERFFHSCELMGLPVELDAMTIREAIRETVRANPGARAVKISAYFASIEIDVVPVDTHVTVAIAAYDPKTDISDRCRRPRPPRRSTSSSGSRRSAPIAARTSCRRRPRSARTTRRP